MKPELWLRGGAAAIATALLLQACASGPPPAPVVAPVAAPPPTPPPPPPPPPVTPKFTATPGLSPRERALRILKLLGDGAADQARPEAEQLLREEPGNPLAQSLYDQIDKDPKTLFGDKNFPYKIQPGDSLSLIAQRFLGDRFLFWALARYNNLDKPVAEVGQTILIPGVASKTPPPRPTRPQRQESEEAAVEARLKNAAPPPTPPPTPRPSHDTARASALRGQALVALNGGQADRAVSLLRQAAGLDPDNAAIKRDLARAERIQATLHK